MAHLPSQPLNANRGHGPIRGSEHHFRAALRLPRLARRDLVWTNVTPHPTAEWIARQITEACPWNEAPLYLIRDGYRRARRAP
jgi:hypothetical protein